MFQCSPWGDTQNNRAVKVKEVFIEGCLPSPVQFRERRQTEDGEVAKEGILDSDLKARRNKSASQFLLSESIDKTHIHRSNS